MRTLACAACLLGAILIGHFLEKVGRRATNRAAARAEKTRTQPPAADGSPPLPDLVELKGLVWMPCDTPQCAHLETTHRRVMATELWACTGCNNTRTAPTKGADRA